MIIWRRYYHRNRRDNYIHDLSCATASLIVTIAISIATILLTTGTAQAQVGDTSSFTPRSWQPAAQGENRARARRSVTSTTSLDEFDVPRRSARTTARIVERKRQPRRVRYAALPRSSDASVAAPRRAAQKRLARGTRVAALGSSPSIAAPRPSLTGGGGIVWRASSGCLAGNLRSVVASVAANYGSVTVNSTCRSARHNRRVGGAKRSWHLTGNAVDFRIRGGSIGRVFAYLRNIVGGGVKHYGGGLFHIDNGPRRSF